MRERLRVLWLTTELSLGGAERLFIEIQRHAGGVEFIPVALNFGDGSLLRPLRRDGFEAHTLDGRQRWDPRWICRLRRVVRDQRPDVVHLNNPYPAAGGRISLLGLDIPTVYTEHSVWGNYHPLSRWANAITLKMSDQIVAVTQAVLDSIRGSWVGRRHQRVSVIPNGVDVIRVQRDAEEQSPPAMGGGMTYGTVGHLRVSKGIDVLLSAARELQHLLPEARGLIVGEGEDRAMLERECRRLRVDSVEFLGLRHDARGIVKRLGVFVMASRIEGLPLALLEAMSLGKPIAATSAGGIPNVLTHGYDALLVPPEDGRALAASIRDLLTDPTLAAELGRNALRTVEERFDVRETARRYEAIYRELTA